MSSGFSLDDTIDRLPGVGPRTAARLRERGLGTIADLLFHLPRAYDDLRRVTPIAALASRAPGETVLVRGTVARVRIFPRRLLDVFVQEEEGGPMVRARWFRPPRGMQKSFTKGARVALAGPLRRLDDDPAVGVELVQPAVCKDPNRDHTVGVGAASATPVSPSASASASAWSTPTPAPAPAPATPVSVSAPAIPWSPA